MQLHTQEYLIKKYQRLESFQDCIITLKLEGNLAVRDAITDFNS